MNGNSCFQLLKAGNSMWRWQANGIGSPKPLRRLVHTTRKVKDKYALVRKRLHARRPMALSRHADEKRRSLARSDLLQAATLQCRAGRPLVDAGPLDAPQLGENSRIRIQNLDPVGNAIPGLLQDEAQNMTAR